MMMDVRFFELDEHKMAVHSKDDEAIQLIDSFEESDHQKLNIYLIVELRKLLEFSLLELSSTEFYLSDKVAKLLEDYEVSSIDVGLKSIPAQNVSKEIPNVMKGNLFYLSSSIEEIAAAKLISQKIALVLLEIDPSAFSFEVCSSISSKLGNWSVFKENFVTKLQEDQNKKDQWINILNDINHDAEEYIELKTDIDVMNNLIQHWNESKSYKKILRFIGRGQFYRWSSFPKQKYTVLLHLDILKWLEVIEKLPCPEIMSEIMNVHDILWDREMILKAIEKADIVWKNDGKWTGKVALMLLTKLVFEHTCKLLSLTKKSKEKGRTTRKIEDEIDIWIKDVWTRMSGRSDGLKNMSEALVEKMHRFIFSEKSKEELESSIDYSLIATFMESKSCFLNFENLKVMWAKTEEKAKGNEVSWKLKIKKQSGATIQKTNALPYFLLVLFPEQLRSTKEKKSIEENSLNYLWEWFAEMLIGRDDAIQSQVNFDNPSYFCLSTISWHLALIKDSNKKWKELWDNLETQRRRYRNSWETDAHHAIDSSKFLMEVGFLCLDWLATKEWDYSDIDRGQKLWQDLAKCSLQYYFMAFKEPHGDRVIYIRKCFARIRNLWQKEGPDEIVEYLRILSGDNESIYDLYWHLVNNGFKENEVVELLAPAGISLDAVEEDLLKLDSIPHTLKPWISQEIKKHSLTG
jgi:hypothetical protein